MKQRTVLILLGGYQLLVASCLIILPAQAWTSDNGDGTFTNPPLFADYPDPDIIRVGDDFYFVTTTFVNSPGMRIMHSKDLVNWQIATHVIPRLDGREEFDLENGGDYRQGVYAPSLRYHQGTFYLAETIQELNTRIYYSKDIRGPWQYHELNRAAFDPALFFDSDGTAYIATSGGWDGHIQLLRLSKDLSRVVDSNEIHYIQGAEGSHIVKRDDWYYLFNAIPSRLAMTVSRAKDLYGPWETNPRDQIDDRTGGHQGAIVDLPDGNWIGFAMKDDGAVGRVTNISPIYWENDWPVWGIPNAPHRIPKKPRKPIRGHLPTQPATTDTFDSKQLGLQWAWNHNPDNSRWSLSERPGFLRLKPTQAKEFWWARNTLTQKAQGPWSRGEVKFDVSNMESGDVCGFGTLGKFSGHMSVNRSKDGALFLSAILIESTAKGPVTDVRVACRPIDADTVFLRTELDFSDNTAKCSYSTDGERWTNLGGAFPMAFDWRTGTFQGEQFAIFCFSPHPGHGFVDVDFFQLDDEE